MTTLTLVCGKNGALRSCKASGHADYAAKGYDIVCAAVTILIRTAMQTLSETDGVVFHADAAERGFLAFEVVAASEEKVKWLICMADFLEHGFSSLQSEYPQFVKLQKQILD
ncbi:MAG: ribosomal-processing cysteine protease Prp [Treponema sp.]|nr:ribosomal-processing cysteine protease Prp [Treponema sp.]